MKLMGVDFFLVCFVSKVLWVLMLIAGKPVFGTCIHGPSGTCKLSQVLLMKHLKMSDFGCRFLYHIVEALKDFSILAFRFLSRIKYKLKLFQKDAESCPYHTFDQNIFMLFVTQVPHTETFSWSLRLFNKGQSIGELNYELRTRDIEKSEPSMLGMNSWIDKCRHALSFLKFQVGLEASSFVMLNARLQRAKFQSNLGKKSCLHTLINPDQHVPNSLIHVYLKFEFIDYLYIDYLFTGDAPSWMIAVFARMKDFIPILMHYIRSRQQIPLSLSLFIAHNARCFDVPFLVKEFLAVCSMDIPFNWLFSRHPSSGTPVDEVEWLFSLQSLLEHFGIQSADATHRAMSDVDLLTAILERMTIDMKLTITDFVEKSFKASDLIDSKTKKKS
ncbi:hypothetical protein CRYUN_Cryun40dG0010600 [Craigia yunnanensis]